ncbi:MAG: hypothetical protein ACKVJM_05720 [Flavobacteriales bacterium]|jgi:hypothetical protein|nr:hypothetical protein [Flavobacteriaceae bacterium]MDO7581199.1 hypothetical protein [Flavobacteriaceae bacterium]MDO7599025.1 hypothetical protein [Flavobacteriaceae bacterium]MDO7602543.1 hypothetical protein [Flavobacteriaceae bacterium]MDO7615313.1 hypothetical protein [Flavobacteriaceae bacterium]|tara:strand:- start:43 stop:435 length:393 start_codon:yes stop_codon:yes gene_type:complete
MKFLNGYIALILLFLFSVIIGASIWEIFYAEFTDGFMPFITVFSAAVWVFLIFYLFKNFKTLDSKVLLKWGLGFGFLFFFNVLVEQIALPFLDLDDTPKNDIYFQIWWICVLFWFLFGWVILKKNKVKII